MITTVLIDDELKALKGLELELQNFKDRVSVEARFTNATNALEYFKKQMVDVVFLDIDMPEMDGLAFLDYFPERSFEVIFTTAYSKYAIDAVKSDAVDYLLKPVDADELECCIQRLEKKLRKNNFDVRFIEAIEKLADFNNSARKIKLSYDGKIVFFHPDELVYFEANGNYTNTFTSNGDKILLTKKLKQLAEELPGELFYRIHNSYIVNLTKIKSFHKNDGMIELDNKVLLPISKQRRIDILEKI